MLTVIGIIVILILLSTMIGLGCIICKHMTQHDDRSDADRDRNDF